PEVLRVESLGEPAVHRREKIAGLCATVLVAMKPSDAQSGPQFPQFGVLLVRDRQGFAIELLGGSGMSLAQQQVCFAPVEFWREPALAYTFGDLQRIIRQEQGLFYLPRDLAGFGQQSDMKG